MGYSAIDTYLRPGGEVESLSEGSEGNRYYYRGPTSDLYSNKPARGDAWKDGRPVVLTEYFELSDASGLSELTVYTSVNFSAGGTMSTTVEEIVYEIEWRPILKPLEVHPDFLTGGTYALDATARKHILGWRAELDPDLRSQRKYKQLDSNGDPAGSETTISGNALSFIKMLEVGVEEWTDYMPIWRKRSIYRGISAPGTSSIGIKTTTPSGSGYPSGYEWVKSRDSAQRMGRAAKWQRDEEWEGAITVYADKSDVFPPS